MREGGSVGGEGREEPLANVKLRCGWKEEGKKKRVKEGRGDRGREGRREG